jgi:hypothetical protein
MASRIVGVSGAGLLQAASGHRHARKAEHEMPPTPQRCNPTMSRQAAGARHAQFTLCTALPSLRPARHGPAR